MEKREIKIALVDDNVYINEENEILIKEIVERLIIDDVNFIIDKYPEGTPLLNSSKTYDLILMDYEMPNTNGLDAAQILEENGNSARILFLSGYENPVLPLQKTSFMKNVVGFVLKTDSKKEKRFRIEKEIKDILDVHLIEIEIFEEKIDFDVRKSLKIFKTVKVDIKKIVTVESHNKTTLIYDIHDNELQTNIKLAKWSDLLPSMEFAKVSKGCILNFKYISVIVKNRIILSDGNEIKIGDIYKGKFYKAWDEYNFREALK